MASSMSSCSTTSGHRRSSSCRHCIVGGTRRIDAMSGLTRNLSRCSSIVSHGRAGGGAQGGGGDDAASSSSEKNATFQSSCDDNLSMTTTTTTMQEAPTTAGMLADIAVRRCISDSVLSGGPRLKYNNKNTMYMMIHRSGGSTVREMIRIIRQRCDDACFDAQEGGDERGATNNAEQQEASGSGGRCEEAMKKKNAVDDSHEQQSPAAASPPSAGGEVRSPEEECCVLAQWAADSYYRIVIASRGGIPAILRAMRVFADDRGLQECCCLALSNLCWGSAANLLAVDGEGGVRRVIAAMRNHPRSVAVQSAACDALRNMSALILAQHAADPDVRPVLLEVLQNANGMYLQPAHKSVAKSLLEAVLRQTAAVSRNLLSPDETTSKRL